MLKRGETLLLKRHGGDSAGAAIINDVQIEIKTLKVFNLEVENLHTFFVGEDGLIVHNGSFYLVPGCRTKSGKPYVGRTKHEKVSKRGKRDGRNRLDEDRVGSYPDGDVEAARKGEQDLIDKHGGPGTLDNRRNEIRKKK